MIDIITIVDRDVEPVVDDVVVVVGINVDRDETGVETVDWTVSSSFNLKKNEIFTLSEYEQY